MKKNSTKKKTGKRDFQSLTLAEMLSEVFYHPDLPEPLEDALREAVTVMFNENIDQTEILELEKQPHYLNLVLRGYAQQQNVINGGVQ